MFKIFGKKKKKQDEDEVVKSTTDDSQNDDGSQDDAQGNDNQSDNQTATMQQAAMAGMMGGGGDIKEMLKSIDTSGMSMKEKMGLKMLQKLPRKKQEEVLRQALNPQELHKNKDMVLKQIDEMVKSGQIQKGQAEAVKAQMGLR